MIPSLPSTSTASLSALQTVAATPAGLGYLASNGRFELPQHVRYLNRRLTDLAARRIRRLMIFAPPRHGKSTLLSQYFPAWYLGFHPHQRVMFGSYEADFAATWGRKARDVLTEWGPSLYGVRVREDSSAANRWDIAEHEGGMTTAGVGGAFTGRGANVLLVDDPIKNAEEALSPVRRQHIKDWWLSTAYTRLEPDGVVILTMTRWHDEDLAGWLLGEGSEGDDEPWTVVNLPALAEEGDALGRQVGAALWPERFPRERLLQIRSQLERDFWWHALYQQRPSPVTGKVFQRAWFNARRYASLQSVPPLTTVVQSVDSAFEEGVESNYSVIAAWGTDGKDCYLLNVWRGQVAYPDLIAAIRDEYARWNRQSDIPTWPGVAAVLIEKKASGQSALQTLRRSTGIPVIGIEPKGSKVFRAQDASPLFEAGRVVLPAEAPWLAEWIDEHVRFPRGKHDDQVDATSQALSWLRRRGEGIAVATSSTPEEREQRLLEQQLAMIRTAQEATAARDDDDGYEDAAVDDAVAARFGQIAAPVPARGILQWSPAAAAQVEDEAVRAARAEQAQRLQGIIGQLRRMGR